jgi:nucleotide-binding universal stress UspA family protein
MFSLIVTATDFSASAENAWRVAVGLAKAHRAELVVLHAFVELPLYAEIPETLVLQVYQEQRRWVQDELDARAKDAVASGIAAR